MLSSITFTVKAFTAEIQTRQTSAAMLSTHVMLLYTHGHAYTEKCTIVA